MKDVRLKIQWLDALRQVTNQRNITDYYEKDRFLGKGAFGKVFRGVSKATGKHVAIKEV